MGGVRKLCMSDFVPGVGREGDLTRRQRNKSTMMIRKGPCLVGKDIQILDKVVDDKE